MPTINPDMFGEELAHLEAHRDEWCAQGQAGRFVVIKGRSRIGGFSRTFEQAMGVAYDAGLEAGQFLVETVLPTGSEHWVSHVAPGHAGA